MTVQEKKAARLRFLNALYEVTEGNELRFVLFQDLGASLGFDEQTSLDLTRYLDSENLLEMRTMDGGINITHQGVIEVESALSHPDQPTHYFPPANMIFIGSMTNSSVQQASPAARQTIEIKPADMIQIASVLGSIQQSLEQLGLTPEHRADLLADVGSVQAQLKASRPKAGVIAECLGSMRAILEGAAGNVVAAGILAQLMPLLAGLGC